MKRHLRDFLADEGGAITVDWVVLTAAVVGIQVVLLVNIISNSLTEVSTDIGEQVAEAGEFLK